MKTGGKKWFIILFRLYNPNAVDRKGNGSSSLMENKEWVKIASIPSKQSLLLICSQLHTWQPRLL